MKDRDVNVLAICIIAVGYIVMRHKCKKLEKKYGYVKEEKKPTVKQEPTWRDRLFRKERKL